MTPRPACTECSIPMVAPIVWDRLAKTERVGVRKHKGRGFCTACRQRQRKAGALVDPRPVRPRLELLEDLSDILEQAPTTTLHGAAQRLALEPDTLTLALRRAARDGDPIAVGIRQRFNAELRKDIAS